MKRLFILLTLALLSLGLCSCGKNKENTIVIGASSTPHALILEQVSSMLEEQGYKLEIKKMDDYTIPNSALVQGSLDANYFQHLPFLLDFNKNNGSNLVSAGAIHYEPFGLYGNNINSLAESTKQILIPNDGSNRSRALLLLQQVGLIELSADINITGNITKRDIVNNNGYDIVELDASNIAIAFKNSGKGTLAVINGNYALSAGINISTALATEDVSGLAATTYANIIAVRPEDLNSPKIQALIAALKSDKIKNYINETFAGAVKPTN